MTLCSGTNDQQMIYMYILIKIKRENISVPLNYILNWISNLAYPVYLPGIDEKLENLPEGKKVLLLNTT